MTPFPVIPDGFLPPLRQNVPDRIEVVVPSETTVWRKFAANFAQI
jgi:hypothetical protein